MRTFAITIIRNTRSPLTKAFILRSGRLEKAAAADLVEGFATQVRLEDLMHFAGILQGLDSHEAIAYGVSRYSRVAIVTQKALQRGPRSAEIERISLG